MCKNDNVLGTTALQLSRKVSMVHYFTKDDTIFPAPAYPMEEIMDPTGAGDSFAGGFIGYIAKQNDTNTNTMKEAMIYGNVMGAFAVEDFGVKKIACD